MKNQIKWKIFFVLLGLSLLSIICVIPYVMTLQGEMLKNSGIPFTLIFIAQFAQSLILFSAAIYFGLIFISKIKFRLPLIEAIINKKPYQPILKKILAQSISLGILTAVIIYILDPLFTSLGVTVSTHQNYAPVWQKLLAAFYGGITEEILLRLFLMTFFVWLSMKLFRQNRPTDAGIIISITLAAIIFGLGHLPVTASLTAVNVQVVIRAVILNGIGGIVFGWLFWRKGLESAMIAHFTTDIFLLTLLPFIFQ